MLPIPIRDLREYVLERSSGHCEFPLCPQPFQEMAHLLHRGMGGGPSRNTRGNVLGLCRDHHRRYDSGQLTPGDWSALLSTATTRRTVDVDRCVWTGCDDLHIATTYFVVNSTQEGYHLCRFHVDVIHEPVFSMRRVETRLLMYRLVEVIRSVESK